MTFQGAIMTINSIPTELRAERDRIHQAISALEAINSTGHRRAGRPPRAMRKRRTVSAAARARMAAAQRARWAKVRAQQKAKQAQASKPVRRMSAAARRKLSRLLKQRWAQGKMKPRAEVR